MKIKVDTAIAVLLEEYKATRHEVEQGIIDISKIWPPVVVGLGTLIGLSSAPLVTRLFLSLPLVASSVLWAIALTRRTNLWAEHIGLRQAFLEHRINTLAGYNMLLHENNVVGFRNKRKGDGVQDFSFILGLYCLVEFGLLGWAFWDRSLLAVVSGPPDDKQFGELMIILVILAVAPIVYWAFVGLLYRRRRRELANDCAVAFLPIGNLTFATGSVPRSFSARHYCSLDLTDNLYREQLSVDAEFAKTLPTQE